jgi:hypothetical protein
MQIRETIDNPSTASTESPPEDVIVLLDSAGVVLGVQHAFSAKVRAVRPGGVSIASKWVEVPLVGGNGQISGVLCRSMPPSDVRGALVSRGPGETRTITVMAQLVVHDINNFLALIGSGLRLLEGQSDSADRKIIVGKMQQAISQAALLSRQLLEAARPLARPGDSSRSSSPTTGRACPRRSSRGPRPERQDHRRVREGLQPASGRGHRLIDRRRLTRLWKRLPAQARPVIICANNSKLPTTTTALDQPEPNQPSKCVSNEQDSPSCL